MNSKLANGSVVYPADCKGRQGSAGCPVQCTAVEMRSWHPALHNPLPDFAEQPAAALNESRQREGKRKLMKKQIR